LRSQQGRIGHGAPRDSPLTLENQRFHHEPPPVCSGTRRVPAAGVLALSFPLHPPGKPERSRAEELLGTGVPTLVVQGGRDPFGRPEEFPGGSYELAEVAYGDHGFAVPKKAPVGQEEALGVITDAVGAWIERLPVG
ncbi:alpha/beta hydrolase family protein, partial [Streptomyces albidoflavus]|uniref:alpha/beta hydrolase family protein n=1 Tax=Streptomyces albidoflavus TaxID=1886 RepID=UPI00352823B9